LVPPVLFVRSNDQTATQTFGMMIPNSFSSELITNQAFDLLALTLLGDPRFRELAKVTVIRCQKAEMEHFREVGQHIVKTHLSACCRDFPTPLKLFEGFGRL